MGGRFAGGAGATAVMEQIVDLLACGFNEAELDGWSLLLSAGAWLSSFPGDTDTAGLTVLFLDEVFAENGTALATGQQDDDTWVEYRADDIAVPSGTRYLRLVVSFTKVDGTNNDGRVDDAWVRISPTISPAPMLDRNLLANPGFESGAGGWNTLLGNVRVRVDGANGVPSYSGGYLLFGGQTSLSPDGAHASALQSIGLMSHGFSAALLDDPDAELFLQVGGWLYSSPGTPAAQAKYTLDVHDSTGGLLASFDAGRVTSAKAPRARRHEMSLPVGTRKIVFSYDSLDGVGVNLDGYLDDASVVITSTPHLRTRGGPVAVGHRGNRIVGPENTVAAFVAARDEAQFVEFDVRQCATGELVVMHDDTVDRTTDGTGEVALMTLAELQALDAGSYFSADFAGEPVPTMGQALASILPDMTPLIERKTGPSSAFVSALQKLGVEQNVVVQSFSWTFLSEMNALDPSIRLAALGSGVLDAAKVTSIQATGAAIVAWAGSDVTATEAALVHAAGMELFVWTVNNPADIDDFIALGVNGIITDDPGAVSWRSDPYAQPNDLDNDGDVDLHDFALYQVTFVDLQDFAQFRTAFTGPR